jgi:Domain of unknown function (DUF4440)
MSQLTPWVAGWALSIGLIALACAERSRPRQGVDDLPMEEHSTLGASFVSGDSAALRRLLHSDLIVQPPVPDSAQQGDAAIEYLLELAAQSALAESRLEPHAVVPEGPFAFEQGIWRLKSGDRVLRSPYTLRWRAGPDGWRVVLWRWGAFR